MSALPEACAPALSRVLLVEDDAGTAELVRRKLVRSGYTVDTAPCVKDGLKALTDTAGKTYDVLLLDYMLPDGQPWELADAAHNCVPEVPVVFVTGMSNENVAIEALRRGFADYVKKSEGFWDELPAVLERVARLNRIKGRLDETSALMGAIVEHSSDLVAVCTGEGNLVYLSPACHSLLGMPALDMINKPWTELVDPEDRDALLALLVSAHDSPERIVTVHCNRRDGAAVWMEARIALLQTFSVSQPMIVLTLHDVTGQREHEQQMQASLREKEVLLREVYHRVKNNLQVIQSLLRMRARTLPEGDAREAIETTGERVHAMAMVHERLYQMRDLASLELEGYLRDMFNGAVSSSSAHPGRIQLELDCEGISLTLDRAIPFGLLVNELLSNSLKHAFPNGRSGTIGISVRRIEGAVRLKITDDGIGLPAGFEPGKGNSMGLKLAISLAQQLGGKLEFISENGCRMQTDLTRL
jgi:PAS domain S-box-containing protein